MVSLHKKPASYTPNMDPHLQILELNGLGWIYITSPGMIQGVHFCACDRDKDSHYPAPLL